MTSAVLSEWARSVWDVHRREVLGVALTALLFRLLTHFVERWADARYKSRNEAAVAVYRIVGLVHHTLQVPLALVVLSDKAMWQDRLYSSTALSTLMVVISSGYFTHDFVHCIENVKVQGVSYIIHGAGCAAVYLFSLLQVPTMLHLYAAGFLMWELSSFFVHARWFLFKAARPSKTLQLVNGLGLLLSFFFARIVWGLYLSSLYWKDILAAPSVTTSFVGTTLVANVALNALNAYWFALILQKAVEALSGRKADALGKRD